MLCCTDQRAVAATTIVWKDTVTLGTDDAPRKTADLYAEDAVLWGTVSEEVRETPEQIYDYFVSFRFPPSLAFLSGAFLAFFVICRQGVVFIFLASTRVYARLGDRCTHVLDASELTASKTSRAVRVICRWGSCFCYCTLRAHVVVHPRARYFVVATCINLQDFFARLPGLRLVEYTPAPVRVYGQFAVQAGSYTFAWEDDDGETVEKRARFSFTFRREKPGSPQPWIIVEHHSSSMPNAPAELKPVRRQEA